MKTLSYVVILLLSFAAPVRAVPVYSGCAAPPSTFRHVWYFDPVHGKTQAAGGNGSQSAPWNNLEALVQAQPGYSFPLLTTAPYRQVPVPGQPAVVATGPKAGPIAPGDEILLMSGNYGDISIGGLSPEVSNSAFVTIAPAPGQTPVLTSLFIGETSKWVIDGLKVQSLQSAARSGAALVQIKDAGATLPTSDIVLENMTISSQDDAEAWSQAQWVADARNGFVAQSTPPGTNTKCVSLTGSHISNVRTGAALLADHLLFANNQIDHFGDDGIDYAASNLAITRNDLHDNLGIDGNHEDAMQGVIGVLAPGAAVNHFQNILIDSNLIIRQTDPELSFPTYLQGIDAFDSDWTNMTVTNNVIVTSACWGMNLASIHDSLIANNTVVDDGMVSTPGCTVAIAVGASTHQGSNSSNTRVTSNLASQIWVFNGFTPSMPAPDHNVAIGPQTSHQGILSWTGAGNSVRADLTSGTDANGNVAITTGPATGQFLAWNPGALSFNLMLKPISVAIGKGVAPSSAPGLPTVDILGATRTAPYAAGAYSYPY
jgi:Right handed beta helix region